MTHILDRPIWSALSTRHAAFAEGGDLARRYPPGIVPFGASRNNGAEGVAALLALVQPGEMLAVVEVEPLALPERPFDVQTAMLVQMLLTRQPDALHDDDRVERLTPADAKEMLALAELTKPGPFTLGAQKLGHFFGFKIGGQIAAMAGVRMCQTGFTEISGVCTHPDFQGQGLARSLTRFMIRRISETGSVPYIHTYATNQAAIGLYASEGFELRTELNLGIIHRPA